MKESNIKTIDTLVPDIYNVLDRGVEITPDPSRVSEFATAMAGHVSKALKKREGSREKGKMWFSDLGEKCQRKQWFKWNTPEIAEELRGNTLFKFLYGNSIEELVMYLAREAGHTVEDVQERIEYTHTNGWTISGRIDAVIDGVLVDVKSASSFAFKKYVSEGVAPENDSFGYAYQLSGYYHYKASERQNRDSKVYIRTDGTLSTEELDRGYRGLGTAFLFCDKQNGNLQVTPLVPLPKKEIEDEIEKIASSVGAGTYLDVARGYVSELEGKSGNEKLGFECSYCPYKAKCWPGVRGFAYSYGPVFLTKVVRTPNVPEFKVGGDNKNE